MSIDSQVSFEYDEKYPITETTKACGKYVIFKILEDVRVKEVNGIVLPETFQNRSEHENYKLMKCEIMSIGKDAESENLQIGDKVLLDKWAVFGRVGYQPGKFGVIDIENIIFKCEE